MSITKKKFEIGDDFNNYKETMRSIIGGCPMFNDKTKVDKEGRREIKKNINSVNGEITDVDIKNMIKDLAMFKKGGTLFYFK